jgi:hypothetical protein
MRGRLAGTPIGQGTSPQEVLRVSRNCVGRFPMSRRSKQIWAIVALVAMASLIVAWPMYKKYRITPVSTLLQERTKKAVDKNPQLQPDWDKAMEDGVLTYPEAKAILEKAGEKVEPED